MRRAGYQPLRTSEHASASKYKRDDSYDGLKPEVPWASIVLAACLTVFGLVSLVLAWLHFTQAILGKQQAEFGFSFIGLITFMPGAYHLFLAYGASQRWRGYSYDDIPSF